ncbi:MAG: hypothetical protein ABFD69_17010 [Candidatus Sumerlaeia bacterium]
MTISDSTESLKSHPGFGGALLADSATQTDTGKVNLQGIFTMFLAWGFPCSRTWFLTFTAFDVPNYDTSVSIGVRKAGSSSISKLSNVKVSEGSKGPSTVSVQLRHRFNSAGRYELVCTFRKSVKKLRIPFEVRCREWPEFSEEEIAFSRKDSHIPMRIRANVQCKKCSHAYIFEEAVLQQKSKGGIQRFPTNGRFKCEECGHTMNLLDIQGQMRASLKELVRNAMKKD